MAAVIVRADVVETKNGARLVGKITKIDGSTVTLTTDYAGSLSIKQGEVTAIRMDSPRFVRLTGGTVMEGTVTPAEAGKIQIKGADGTITTSVEKIAATWEPGSTDPAVLALERKWTYEASVDVTGKSGNSEQLGTAFAFRAQQTGPHDKLKLYTAYNRQQTDGAISADQFKAGIDYSNNFSGRTSWYVRDEGGYDHVKDINFYNTSAAGFGYDFIQKPLHLLTGRAGLSFRYEDYKNPATQDLQDVGFDFGIHHEYTFDHSKLVNNLSYTPLLNDFADFHFEHESYYEIPLLDPKWKLRIGISHDYNSKPGTGVDRLDTTYFTRLVLDWD
ncbi:MAG TPA: DUF481 domain-containing protein [Rariglobus sp.]|nr:DUF481 domain-containing protein [Rariglobus sp.]